MKSRLFHSIVVCGASLGVLPLGCSAAAAGSGSEPSGDEAGASGAGAAPTDTSTAERCRLPDGSCNEHCSPLADGGCIDPCFVHTATCSPDCLLLDGSCGWPPTK